MSNYKIFNTGIYLRLSRDDGNNSVSESILNQKSFLIQYVIQNGFNLVDVYIDDGYSGTNFDRPDFKRMIADIESKKINCVVTKDLSRLGRDYIMTGHYLERYFPENQVRYIAVNDGIDTYEENNNNDMSPFKAVINDMYAKDISKKVKTALATKKANGMFIGSVAPYGYKKDTENKGHLVIDPETAPIVKRIFSMFIQGVAKLGIANQLSIEHIPTPSEFKNLTATQRRNKGVWNEAIISRILTNPTYIGNLTQNRSKKINYKVKAKQNLPENQWIIVENTHEPIVTAEEFEMVQKIIKKRTYQKKDGKPHLLSGLLRCGDCGGHMSFVHSSKIYVACSTWRKHAKLKLCTSHLIREDYLEKEVLNSLKNQAEEYINQKNVAEKCANAPTEDLESKSNVQSLELRLEEIKNIITNLYVDKTRGIITETDFLSISAKFNSERESITNRLQSNSQEEAERNKSKDDVICIEDLLKKFLSFEEIDRNTLLLLVEKVEIFEDKKIKIYFSFHV